jgi:hypothetical protein
MEKVDDGEIVIEHCPTEQMWTDINTKPKQGKVFRKFWGHVMGIPADYNDDDYRKDVVTIPPVSTMLPIPRAKESLQECVGGNLIGPRGKQRNEQSSVHSNLTATRPKEECLNAGVQAPIKIVDGRHWSPGVYRNLRLMGFTLEVAWGRAFISLTFYLIFVYKVTHEHCLAIPSKPGMEEYVASTLSNKRQTKSTEEA